MAQLNLPASISTSFQGNAQAFQDSLSTVPMLILAALFVVYIILGILYESAVLPHLEITPQRPHWLGRQDSNLGIHRIICLNYRTNLRRFRKIGHQRRRSGAVNVKRARRFEVTLCQACGIRTTLCNSGLSQNPTALPKVSLVGSTIINEQIVVPSGPRHVAARSWSDFRAKMLGGEA
jgi:AcrB/AcrD/AcrF family